LAHGGQDLSRNYVLLVRLTTQGIPPGRDGPGSYEQDFDGLLMQTRDLGCDTAHDPEVERLV
jgi:hypothetical protein